MKTFYSKYKVLCKIGEGSFSEVLKCEDKTTKKHYAAKRLKKLYKNIESVRYCAEIYASKQVPYHPNVLNVLEYFFDAGMHSLIFVFELMDMSMYEYLKSRNRFMPENKVKHYLYQILKGVGHLHSHGIFHRDIKPENILIKMACSYLGNELVKIGDLGSVRGVYTKQPYTEYISTRWYRSPECLLTAGHYGPKMDIWAIGLRPLFPGVNELDQLGKIHYVLGTPETKYFHLLKSKSRNCICFPKFRGIGLDILLLKCTSSCRNVIKLMLEYNVEKRPSIGLLLRHVFFKEISDECSRRKSDSEIRKTNLEYLWKKCRSMEIFTLNDKSSVELAQQRGQMTSLFWNFKRSQTVQLKKVKSRRSNNKKSKFSSQ